MTNKLFLKVKISAVRAVLLAAAAIFTLPLCAQTSAGSIVGTVTDNTGAVIPGATVTITDIATMMRTLRCRIQQANIPSSTCYPPPIASLCKKLLSSDF
jgi:hypothetical protein